MPGDISERGEQGQWVNLPPAISDALTNSYRVFMKSGGARESTSNLKMGWKLCSFDLAAMVVCCPLPLKAFYAVTFILMCADDFNSDESGHFTSHTQTMCSCTAPHSYCNLYQ